MSACFGARVMRATSVVFSCAAFVAVPGVASAVQTTHRGVSPASSSGLGDRLGVGPTTELSALRIGIAAASAFFGEAPTGCATVTPVLASVPGLVMAGNFRDIEGNCYVWLNLQQAPLLSGSEICKLALHEMGHLSGLQHSADPDNVMYAPFRATPLPDQCADSARRSERATTHPRGARVCPLGARSPDYCGRVARSGRTRRAGSRSR
jgi:hypothetical protein